VINLPWLNEVDAVWLREAIAGSKRVYALDNHYAKGGQGDVIARAMAGFEGLDTPLICLGIKDIPPSGTNPQVLGAVGLDVDGLVRAVKAGYSR
jgi:transketolase